MPWSTHSPRSDAGDSDASGFEYIPTSYRSSDVDESILSQDLLAEERQDYQKQPIAAAHTQIRDEETDMSGTVPSESYSKLTGAVNLPPADELLGVKTLSQAINDSLASQPASRKAPLGQCDPREADKAHNVSDVASERKSTEKHMAGSSAASSNKYSADVADSACGHKHAERSSSQHFGNFMSVDVSRPSDTLSGPVSSKSMQRNEGRAQLDTTLDDSHARPTLVTHKQLQRAFADVAAAAPDKKVIADEKPTAFECCHCKSVFEIYSPVAYCPGCGKSSELRMHLTGSLDDAQSVLHTVPASTVEDGRTSKSPITTYLTANSHLDASEESFKCALRTLRLERYLSVDAPTLKKNLDNCLNWSVNPIMALEAFAVVIKYQSECNSWDRRLRWTDELDERLLDHDRLQAPGDYLDLSMYSLARDLNTTGSDCLERLKQIKEEKKASKKQDAEEERPRTSLLDGGWGSPLGNATSTGRDEEDAACPLANAEGRPYEKTVDAHVDSRSNCNNTQALSPDALNADHDRDQVRAAPETANNKWYSKWDNNDLTDECCRHCDRPGTWCICSHYPTPDCANWNATCFHEPDRYESRDAGTGCSPSQQAPRSSYTVSYQATIESGGERIHIPIDGKHVSGPEKAVISDGMAKAWKWVFDKALEDKVGLQDAFDLAQSMHKEEAKVAAEEVGGEAWSFQPSF